MKPRTTAVLLLLLLATAGVYLGTRPGPGGRPAAPAPAPAGAPLLPAGDTRRVVVSRAGERFTADRRPGGAWIQRQPATFPLRAEPVEALVHAARTLAPRQRLTPRADTGPAATAGGDGAVVPSRSELGLGPGAARVLLVGPDRVDGLTLGRREVAGTAWLAVDGDLDALLVDAAVHDAVAGLLRDPDATRPDALPGPPADTVNRIGFTGSARPDASPDPVVLVRDPAGWRFVDRDAPASTRLTTPARAARPPEDGTYARADRDAAARLAGLADPLPVLRYAGTASNAAYTAAVSQPKGGSSSTR